MTNHLLSALRHANADDARRQEFHDACRDLRGMFRHPFVMFAAGAAAGATMAALLVAWSR